MRQPWAFALTGGYYAALFCAFGAHLPYWPVWLVSWGLTEAEIGAMLGVAIFARVLGSTVFPAIADRFAIRRALLAAAAGLSALIIASHLAVESKGVLLTLTLLMAFVSAPLIPVGEALGLRAAQQHQFAYSHARAIGSLAFLLTVLGLGPVIDWFGPGAALYVITGCLLICAVLGSIHPGGGAAPGVPDHSRMSDIIDLGRNRLFVIFAVSAALGQAAHGIYYTFSALQWSAAGMSATKIGTLWSIGVAAEILLLFGPGRRWVSQLGPARALVIAGLAGLLRWGAMYFEPTGLVLWPLQALHALTFGLTLLGTMAFIDAAVPARLGATAQGLSAGLFGGISLALITIGGAQIAPSVEPGTLYLLAFGASFIAFSAACALLAGWRGGRLIA